MLATIVEEIKRRMETAIGACIKPLIKLKEWLKRVRNAIKLLVEISNLSSEGYSQQLRIEERMKELRDSLPSEKGKDAKAIFDFISKFSKEDLERITTFVETTRSIQEKDAEVVLDFISKAPKEKLERAAKILGGELEPEKMEEKIKKMREMGDISEDEFEKIKNALGQTRRLRNVGFDYVPTKDETEKLEQIRLIMGMAKLLPKDELEITMPSSEETHDVIKNIPVISELKERINEIEEQLKIESLYSKGIVLLEKGTYKEACECFDEITKMNPNLKGVWLNKGVALGCLGKIEKEIECYNMALSIDKNYENALHNKEFALKKLAR